MLTCDPPYWSLDGYCLPLMTLLWPKNVGRQLSVTNGSQRPFILIGHGRLWPRLMVIYSMTKILVIGNLNYPRHIQRGQSYMANLRPNQIVLNRISPAQFSFLLGPNPKYPAFHFFGPWSFNVHISYFQPFISNTLSLPNSILYRPWPFYRNITVSSILWSQTLSSPIGLFRFTDVYYFQCK
jgi:hypothetical protein